MAPGIVARNVVEPPPKATSGGTNEPMPTWPDPRTTAICVAVKPASG